MFSGFNIGLRDTKSFQNKQGLSEKIFLGGLLTYHTTKISFLGIVN
jgi:hypothetical protein